MTKKNNSGCICNFQFKCFDATLYQIGLNNHQAKCRTGVSFSKDPKVFFKKKKLFLTIFLGDYFQLVESVSQSVGNEASKMFFCLFIVVLGGGGGEFSSSGRSSTLFGGSMGKGGEGGKGFLQGGVGGRALTSNAVGGFGEGGGAYGAGGGSGGGGGYSGESSGDNEYDSCGGGGGSYNAGKNQQNECCYTTAGHGQVTITLL